MSRQFVLSAAALAVFVGVFAASAEQSTPSGWITDAATGEVVVNATLRITPSGAPVTGRALASARARSDGGFDLPKQGVNGVLEVTAPGYATKRLLWPPRDAASNIRLERSATLPVQVRDAGGALLSARLAITTFHPGNIVADGVRVPGGAVDASELLSGPTLIVALAEGMAPAAATVRIEAGVRHAPLNITMQPAAAVGGQVMERNGVRRPDAEIVVEYGSEVPFRVALANYLSRRRPVGGELDFHVRNVVPRVPVRVYARHGATRSAVSTVVLDAGQERSDLVLVLD